MNDGSEHLRDQADRGCIKLVRGHFLYGMHRAFEERTEYFTILREPLSRMRSYLNHMASEASLNPDNNAPFYHAVRHWESAEQHFRIHPRPIDNFMTRALSGVDFPPGACSLEILEKACAHLDEMRCFGIFERLNESAVLMARCYNWSVIPVLSRAKSGNPTVINLTSADKKFLHRLNCFDRQLYEYAARRFETLIAHQRGLRTLSKVYKAATPAVTIAENTIRAALAKF